jgi:hypothetical protein
MLHYEKPGAVGICGVEMFIDKMLFPFFQERLKSVCYVN